MIRRTPTGSGVSRETRERLEAFAAVLVRWNSAINLVARSTVDELWSRHIEDSLQLFAFRPGHAKHWVDLGSGGGFPGLVLAIHAASEAPEMKFTLVESDARKVSFLQAAARAAQTRVTIHCARAESLPSLRADVLSARALAPLSKLLELAHHHLSPEGRALFPKGRSHAEEINAALEKWRFSVQKHPSLTDPTGVILSIEGVERA